MKKRIPVLIALLLWVSLPGCNKEEQRLDSYFVEFATVIVEGTNYRFRLDDGTLLTPRSLSYKGFHGQRVLLNFVRLEGENIKVRKIINIFTADIRQHGFPEEYRNAPVKIESIWVRGGYLNLVLEIEYHDKDHQFALFRDRSAATIDLYLSHDTNNDPPGSIQKRYASFNLKDLRNGSTDPIPFRVIINSYTGTRIFNFELK